jgi:hypothetical protein
VRPIVICRCTHHCSTCTATLPEWYQQDATCACRIASDGLLSGFGQLDMQHAAKQLTSLSIALSCTAAEAQWQTNADMLAALAQFSELRHLDVGNCLFVPAEGAHSPFTMPWDIS